MAPIKTLLLLTELDVTAYTHKGQHILMAVTGNEYKVTITCKLLNVGEKEVMHIWPKSGQVLA